jgi:hypothetical protein
VKRARAVSAPPPAAPQALGPNTLAACTPKPLRHAGEVSSLLFDPLSPEPAAAVAAAHNTFGSGFFEA